jgi:hypothetical protein
MGARRRDAASANHSGSDSARSQTTISMSDTEFSDDDAELVQRPPPVCSPSLTAVLPAPSPIGKGDHIFAVKTRKRLDPAPPSNASAGADYPNFRQYKNLLRYRSDDAEKNAQIFHPAAGDVGDGEAWYYVTVGRNVGVFNAWYISLRFFLKDPTESLKGPGEAGRLRHL